MKYYKLEEKIDKLRTIFYANVPENYLKSIYDLKSRDKLSYTPNLKHIQLKNSFNSIKRDILRLSSTGNGGGIIISDKLLNVFKEFLLPKELQIFDAIAIHKGREYHYNYFYIYEANEERVFDFENNYFIKTNFGFPEDDYFKIDYKELKKRSLENYEELTPKEIIVKPENITSDIFRLDLTMSGYYVSQRLKEAVEKAECKGLKFIPIEELKYKHK